MASNRMRETCATQNCGSIPMPGSLFCQRCDEEITSIESLCIAEKMIEDSKTRRGFENIAKDIQADEAAEMARQDGLNFDEATKLVICWLLVPAALILAIAWICGVQW